MDYMTVRQAAQAAEPYLTRPDLGLRLSACWIYGYANLTTGQIRKARRALETVQRTLADGKNLSPDLRAAVSFVAAGAAVLLHLPLPEGLPSTREFLPLLPNGLRAFALYVQAHSLYLREDYAKSVGMAEAALAMGAEAYPISAIYLHLVAVMDYMRLRQLPQAQGHLLAAWTLARPDDLIEGFGKMTSSAVVWPLRYILRARLLSLSCNSAIWAFASSMRAWASATAWTAASCSSSAL